MLNSLTLTNFRGFARLELPKLARVNLIGGVNNAGKTALLEAIFLLLEKDQGNLGKLPSLFRAASGVNDDRYFWRWIAHNGNLQSKVLIEGILQNFGEVQIESVQQGSKQGTVGGVVVLQKAKRIFVRSSILLERNDKAPGVEVFSPPPTAPVEDARIYVKASKKNAAEGEKRIESLLREIEPRLSLVRAYPDEQTNQPILHVGLEGVNEALPASQLGQGFNRLLRIYSALICADAKIFLIDEVETGLHHSVLPTIWLGLAAVARQENVQIFATTHSREAILDAHRVFSKEPSYDFAYHRLERVDGETRVVTYDRERLEGADERNFEMR
jgi:AAA15 family ATPase/GTPase